MIQCKVNGVERAFDGDPEMLRHPCEQRGITRYRPFLTMTGEDWEWCWMWI